MTNIGTKIFDGINVNHVSEIEIKPSESVNAENVIINKPYGALKRVDGLEKWNTIGMANPIMALFQLKKHRWTGVNQNVFSLIGSRIILGKPQDYDYWYDYWSTYTAGWTHNSNTLNTSIVGTSTCGYDADNNLFLTRNFTGTLYYGSLDSSGILQSTSGSFSVNSSAYYDMKINYDADLIFLHTNTTGTSIYKYQLSTGTLLGTYTFTAGSGIGEGYCNYFDYDFENDYAYIADYINKRVVKTKLDGLWTGWQAFDTSFFTAGGYYLKSIFYDKYNDYIYVSSNIYNGTYQTGRVLKFKMGETSYEIFTSENLFTSDCYANCMKYDNSDGMFYFINDFSLINKRLIKTNFINYYNSIQIDTSISNSIQDLFLDFKIRWVFVPIFESTTYQNIKKFDMDLL